MADISWVVEYTDEFGAWFESLVEEEQESIAASVKLLEIAGPALTRPHADTLKGSRLKNLKELRTQHAGRPFRTLFVFDPRRHAILLIGGDKIGDGRFYERMIPLAEALYHKYLEEVAEEISVLRKRKS